jgi:hypothetical protein
MRRTGTVIGARNLPDPVGLWLFVLAVVSAGGYCHANS